MTITRTEPSRFFGYGSEFARGLQRGPIPEAVINQLTEMSELFGEDIAAIDEVHRRWIEAELAGNASRVIELCTDDVNLIPPDAPPLVGKKAVENYLNESVAGLKDIQTNDTIIHCSGSLAYLTSNYHARFVVEGDSEIREAAGTHLWVLTKMKGVWLVAVVTWSGFQPARGAGNSIQPGVERSETPGQWP